PCITRDFHGYHLLPPMVDKFGAGRETYQTKSYEGGETEKINLYRSVDPTNKVNETNSGDDAAAATVWNSPVCDVSRLYSFEPNKKRFWPAKKVDPGKSPTDLPADSAGNRIDNNTFDYERQDDSVHYEELRGMYSRRARSAEQPIRVPATLPYYVNQYAYPAIWYK